MKKTEEFDVTSIAFAALGTGLLQYPAEIVGECFIKAEKQYCETNPKTKLTAVYVLAYHKDEPTKKVRIEGQVPIVCMICMLVMWSMRSSTCESWLLFFCALITVHVKLIQSRNPG